MLSERMDIEIAKTTKKTYSSERASALSIEYCELNSNKAGVYCVVNSPASSPRLNVPVATIIIIIIKWANTST